jgi:predicted DCC family thiol-disulfide oxidoreductase YuxK
VAKNAEVRAPARGWILYDGECGFCSRWVNFWAKTLVRRGFEPAALQEPWVAQKLQMPVDSLLADIRLLPADGQLVSGADVYLYVTRRIWWAWPFYAVFSLPGFNWLLHTGYRWFAGNRHCISHSCKLRPQ